MDMKKGSHAIVVFKPLYPDWPSQLPSISTYSVSGYKIEVMPMDVFKQEERKDRWHTSRQIAMHYFGAAENVDPSEAERVKEYIGRMRRPDDLSARHLAENVGTPWTF